MRLPTDLEQDISQSSGEFGVIRARRFAAALDQMCGSPIEVRFACLMAAYVHGMESRWCLVRSDIEAEAAPEFYIWPQRQIGRHRVDFVIGKAGHGAVVVECDGREFHHVTREQIERDRARDDELKAGGWRVMRFPGAQITNDPWRAPTDVWLEIDPQGWEGWWRDNDRFMS